MFKNIYAKWKNLDRRIRWASIFSSLVVVYALIGFFLVPVIVKSVVEKKLPAVLNRAIDLQGVKFNPFALDLELDGFSVAKKDGEGNLFSFKSLDLNFDSLSLLTFSAEFDKLEIVDPQINLTIFTDGSTTISDLIPEAVDDDQPVEKDKSFFPFSIQDLIVTNGTYVVYDTPKDFHHLISNFNLFVPFTSSLSRHSDDFVQPSLDMTINGTPFVLQGQSLPFKNTLQTEFNFSLENADLGEYWVYLPIHKTTTLKSGKLSSAFDITFVRGEELLPKILLGGQFYIRDFDLVRNSGEPLLKFKELAVDIDEMSLLRKILKIKSAKLTDPHLKIGLKADGSLDLIDVVPMLQSKSDKPAAPTDDEPGFFAEIQNVTLVGGNVDFTDKAFGNGFTKQIGPLSIIANNITTEENKVGTYAIQVGSAGKEVVNVDGTLALAPLIVKGLVSVKDLNIPDYQKYLEKSVPLAVTSGKVGLSSNFNFAPQDNGLMRLEGLKINVKAFELSPKAGGDPLIGLGGFAVSNGTIDVGKKSVSIGSVDLTKALIKLTRDKDGIDLLKHIKAHGQAGVSNQTVVFTGNATESVGSATKVKVTVEEAVSELKPVVEDIVKKADAGGWKVLVTKVNLADSAFEFLDKAAPKDTPLSISKLSGGIKGISYPENNPLQLNFDGVVNKRGSLNLTGKGVLAPVDISGAVKVRKIRLREFNGYLPAVMQMSIARGHIDASGDWTFSNVNEPVATYKGKAQIKDMLLRDAKGDKQFFHLNELAVRDIDFISNPLRIDVRLIDVIEPNVFVAREEDGTMNVLRILTGKLAPPVDEKAIAAQAKKSASKGGVLSGAAKDKDVGDLVSNSTTAHGTSGDDGNFIFFNKMAMSNGTLILKDYMVSPAFELDITKMRSAVFGIELPYGDRTELSFNATLDQQAPLVAEGYIQPADDGADTDLHVTLINLDMTQLSPYTRKYIAYPVSTGMLSADVALALRGTLLSTENVFDIYQFEVGKKIDNPDAANIPIGLGLALLRDSNGNIQLDIPVEGRVDDPQFRLGRVIGAAILNILVKAVTSPFALIGALIGGSDDMDVLVFEPGLAVPKEEADEKLASVAKAMESRPGITLKISGFTSPEDIPALEGHKFNRMVAMPKFLDLESDGKAPKSIDDVVISEEEYPEYLEEAYKEAPFEKPTNFLGIVESRPVPEMEQALRDHVKVTDTDLAELVRDRAERIRIILTTEKGVASERVFLKRAATGKGNGPRVELGLGN
ncbi:DUF748 domain-containing protein [Maridesulfovibrio frigidus]|uniref:DUF748 domain-containing protein n=1 Tax=Maridesulfovibrio frigidus TaxID=340956 RepID=UPI0004E1EEB4|nr:DUF748 domain-containing protein [Maridesulfovibrio frigidus]